MKNLIDFSAARPKGKDIKALGIDGVLRYLCTSDWKRLTADEVKDYHANGLGIGVVFEDAANNPLGGKKQGVADATKALSQANALGFPASVPIYFAVDFDTTPAQQATIDEYLRGAASVIGADRVGVYGSFYVVERCAANKTAKWFWQTLAWSGKQVSKYNHILQNLKPPKIKDTDENEAVDNWGGWYGSVAPAPTPAPSGPLYFRYGHAKELLVKVGDTVKKGQKIGTIGKGGPNNFSAHVHFDIPKNKLNPWTAFVINKSKEFVAENYQDPEPYKYIVLPNFSHEGLDFLEFYQYSTGPAYHPGDDLNSGSGDSDFGHPFFSACDGVVVYAYNEEGSNNGWGRLLVIEERNSSNPNPPMEGKSKVEPELRDALKYAHDIEIGEYIDPQDQRLMAEHLRLLKDSEMAARKKVDAVRDIVA